MNSKGSRRRFLSLSAAASGVALVGSGSFLAPSRLLAEPFGLPAGIQLYSVRDQLKQDFEGTLEILGHLGYREVEAAGFYGKNPAEVRSALSKAGLRCVSSHSPYSELALHFDDILAYAKSAGISYLVCSSPGHRTTGANGKLDLEDWRWNANEFNRMGGSCRKAGIRFGYHNHVAEFVAINGVVPYLELLRLTDPALVTMEMDCGWVAVGGGDPVTVMKAHPGRISMLHVKDFKSISSPEREHTAAELGHGVIDYAPIFAEAKRSQAIRHVFVEQEQFERPFQEALQTDLDYLKRFS